MGSTPKRHRLPQLVGALVVGLLLPVLVVPPAAAAGTADRPRTGYRIRADGTAAGGWFGSRTVARRAVYRIDPGAAPRSPGFTDARWVGVMRGSGPVRVDRWRVRRAAWIVAKYGTYDSDSQAAAVEMALHHLLHGGKYALGGSATQRRLRQTGDRETIVALARYMLDHSRDLLGPYRIRVGTTGAVLGGRVRVRVVVTSSGTGQGIPHLPVTVRYDGRTLTGSTDPHGVLVTTARARVAGPRPVRVTVGRLPTDRLLVRRSVRRGGSRVVVAGRKITAGRRAEAAVQAKPRVSVTAPGQSTVAGAVPGTIQVSAGYPSSRTATVTLHGPFAPGVDPSCDPGLAVASRSLPVAADGRYPAPTIRVTKAGIYRWAVRVPADDYNAPASVCGDSLVVKAVPTLSVAATATPVQRGTDAFARVKASALPDDFTGRATVRLYGPFTTRGAVACGSARQARWRAATLTGPSSSVLTDAVTLNKVGYYGWRAVLPASELTTKATTSCRASGSILRVR